METLLTNLIDHALQIVAAGAIAYVGRHVGAWLRGHREVARAAQALNVHQLIQMLAADAVAYVEEQAHKEISKGAAKLSSHDKLSMALNYGAQLARARGLDRAALREFSMVIEARLGASR